MGLIFFKILSENMLEEKFFSGIKNTLLDEVIL
jgi:hypothetical protein